MFSKMTRWLLLIGVLCFFSVNLCWAKTPENVDRLREAPIEKSLFGSTSRNAFGDVSNATFSNGSLTSRSNHGREGGPGTYEEDDGEHMDRYPVFTMDFERVQSPLIISLWLFIACLGKIAFHMAPRLSHIFPESVIIIVLGLLIGGILVYANPNPEFQVSPLTADTFFIYLLPPIILDAGYFMPNRLFFDHLGTILMFAVIGTIWNALSIGTSLYALSLTGLFGNPDDFPMLHVFLFSTLISAVDPVAVLAVFEEIHVEEVLFILVFGESLLNDGITVVLYHMFEGFSLLGEGNIHAIDLICALISFFFVALGGTAIGVIWGFLTAFVTRFTNHTRVIEPVFIFIMSYLAYLNAELFHLSGILAIAFCGITMKNYTEQNISENSSTTTKYAMKMLASSMETVIFLFLGVATVHGTEHEFNGWFILFTILFCSVYRCIGVLTLSAVCNRFRVQKIDFVQKFVMCYGGLRGAVAFALAITIDSSHIELAPMFVTTTIAVVFFTVFIQGTTIKPLTDVLGVKKAEKRNLSMNERFHERIMDYIMAGIESISGKLGRNKLRNWFKRFNNRYLLPFLVRNVKANEPKLLETLTNLKLQEAMEHMDKKPNADLESLTKVLQESIYNQGQTAKEFNLDFGELDYNPNARDQDAARFHHILDKEYRPMQRRRQSTYKRHAVNDSDLGTNDFHQRMFAQARQVAMTSIRNRKNKKVGEKNSLGLPPVIKQNGSAIKLKNDYLEETMAKTNPAFVDDDGGIVLQFKPAREGKRFSVKGPTAAETILPWKRFSPDDVPANNMKIRRTLSLASEEDCKDVPPTMAEIVLPWKRCEDDDDPYGGLVKQNEFPSWANNKEYNGNYSPSNTLLGKLNNNVEKKPTAKEIFERNQNQQSKLERQNTQPELPVMRNSAKDGIYFRRSSLKEDPLEKRGSMKDLWDKAHPGDKPEPSGHSHGHHHHGHNQSNAHENNQIPPLERKNTRDSLGADSLLATVIEEEKSPKPRKRDHVIRMESEEDPDNTKF